MKIMNKFDPILEATNRIYRRKAVITLFVSLPVLFLGIFIIIKYGKLNLFPKEFALFSLPRLDAMFGLGHYGFIISLVAFYFIMKSLIGIKKYKKSENLTDFEKEEINRIEKETTSSEKDLFELADKNIRKRGNILDKDNEDN
jgi:hypothetical protein